MEECRRDNEEQQVGGGGTQAGVGAKPVGRVGVRLGVFPSFRSETVNVETFGIGEEFG